LERRTIEKTTGVKTILAAMALSVLCGCASYFRITDTTNGKVYVTDSSSMDRHLGGSLEFKDLKTGDEVTVQNTEVRQISSSDAKTELQQ
jgi:hypothetical protein